MRRYSVIPSVLPSLRISILYSSLSFSWIGLWVFIVIRDGNPSITCFLPSQLYVLSLFVFILITPTRLTIQVVVLGPFTLCACSARLWRRVPQLPSSSIPSSQLRPPVGRGLLSFERCASRSKFCFPLLIIILGLVPLPWLSARESSATLPPSIHGTLGAFPGSFSLSLRIPTWTVLVWSVWLTASVREHPVSSGRFIGKVLTLPPSSQVSLGSSYS